MVKRLFSIQVWAFGGILLYLLISLFFQWSGHPDPVNDYFRQNATLLNLIYYAGVFLGLASFIYFAYRSPIPTPVTKEDKIMLVIFFLSGLLFYLGSFHFVLAPNGDNAEYIINAKSLVERGGIFRLDTPSETPNSLASLGLPLLLSPIYFLYGLNFVPMKIMVFLLCLSIGPLLFIFFRQEFSFHKSALLAAVSFTSPYLVTNSVTIMTEGPYLFWSLLALIFIRKFTEASTFRWQYYFLMFFFLIWAYLTRIVGIALVVAVIFYFITDMSGKDLFSRTKDHVNKLAVKKMLWVLLPLLLGLIFWQWRQRALGISQADVFLQFDFQQHLSDNWIAFKNVLGQILFSPSSFRWYKQSADFTLSAFHFGWLLLLVAFFWGLFYDLLQRKIAAYYTISVLLIILLASLTPQERVFMRYLSVLIPFIIYHLYSFITLVSGWIDRSAYKSIARLSPALSLLFLGHLYISGLSSDRYNVLTKGAVFNAYYESFLKAAEWCGQHLPPDAYVMSVKPRIVYLYSGLHGLPATGERDVYSAEYEREKLAEIKSKNVTHIIVDAISRSSMEDIHPVIQNNPDKFEKLPVPELDDKCTVVRVRDY